MLILSDEPIIVNAKPGLPIITDWPRRFALQQQEDRDIAEEEAQEVDDLRDWG